MIGHSIEHYKIVEKLGEGGMGVVYKALDTRLDRFVALKLLAAGKVAEPDRRLRFIQEAKAASALNHPNIITVYDIGHVEGYDYIAMEYIQGRTLQQLIGPKSMEITEAVRIAVQMADAIAAAHAHGIIHRDLKPANVMVTADGAVKLLDFGLAKLYEAESTENAETATIGALVTRPGVIVGTAPYLSPERLSGKRVDARSDIFAFGIVLYEMLTGARPFIGETDPDILYAILHRAPRSLSEARPDAPVELRIVVEKSLEKDPAERYQSMREALVDLKRIHRSTISQALITQVAPAPARKQWWMAVAACVAAVALATAVYFALRKPPPEQGSRLVMLLSSAAELTDPVLSPDGKMIAYIATDQGRTDLFVSRAAGGERLRLTNDEASESTPDFSPDGERISFTRVDPETRLAETRVVPTLGGAPVPLLPRASNAAWSPDGTRFAFVKWGPGQQVSLATANTDGSGERVLLPVDGKYPAVRHPAWSPDGRQLAVIRSTGGMAGEIWLLPAQGGEPRRFSNDGPGVFADRPAFTPDGKGLVFESNRGGAANLWMQPLNGGTPVRLTNGPGPDESPTVARDGTIAFVNARSHRVLFLHDLATGSNRELSRHAAILWSPRFSSDGRQLTYSQSEPDGAWHIWRILTEGGTAQRVTSGPVPEVYSRFTPDGAGIIFSTWSSGPDRVWLAPLGGGPPRALTPERTDDDAYADISPDGRSLAFARTEGPQTRLYIAPMAGGAARLLVNSESTVPRWSPNGEWIAFSIARTFMAGIFVVRADGTGLRRVAPGGSWPVWFPDGSKIAYLSQAADGNQEVLTVPFQGGTPQPIRFLHFSGANYPVDISPDGKSLATTNTVHFASEIWKLEPARR